MEATPEPTPAPPLRAIDRIRLVAQRFWQPTSACMTCMPGSLGNLWSLGHWEIALRTGLLTGVLVLLVSFTPVGRALRRRNGNAMAVGALTTIGDAYSHLHRDDLYLPEPLLTGLVAGALAWIASWLLEDRARRVRAVWQRLRGR